MTMAGNAVAVLRNILADAAIVKLLTIKEGISGVQLFCGERRITVLDVPENSIAINMHIASPRTGGILPQERRARTHSDYAIIGTADNQDFIAYIEASDTSAQRSDTEKRLREAVCVMDYCAAIAREFQDSDGLLAGYRRHFVKIKAHGRINRRFNFSSRLLENDSPGNLRVLEGVEIPFRYLIA
jgi:hypothetical protein